MIRVCGRSANEHRAMGIQPMAWLLLFVAGLCEVAWAIGLKYSDGFSRLYPSIATAAAMGASIGLLGLALKTLPVGTAYAVWTGIGAAGTVALGIYLFGEPATALRLICIGLILAGIAGLRIAS
jgi:quaternary ammonium compound-resistance protein SugE